uniref:Uncharacterized protein n=1 Tax=Pararge aegeria TaxID=116150 RepID=S4NYM3_9NEOP
MILYYFYYCVLYLCSTLYVQFAATRHGNHGMSSNGKWGTLPTPKQRLRFLSLILHEFTFVKIIDCNFANVVVTKIVQSIIV